MIYHITFLCKERRKKQDMISRWSVRNIKQTLCDLGCFGTVSYRLEVSTDPSESRSSALGHPSNPFCQWSISRSEAALGNP